MSSEQSRRIDGLVDAALQLSPEEAEQFLRNQCGTDESTLREALFQLGEAGDEQHSDFVKPLARRSSAVKSLHEASDVECSENLPITLDRPLRIGDYELWERIGEGGMGVVYKARQLSLDRVVALKMICAGELTDTSAMKRFENAIKRFHNEAKAAAKIQHPNVCVVYDFVVFEGRPFITMEYIDGKTLKEHLETHATTPEEALNLIVPLADGLSKIHAGGIWHRDLKPGNIKFDHLGVPKILDFGLAKLALAELNGDPALTQQGSILGSVPYMSPEQARGSIDEIDQRSDIYALGVIFYEMLTGRWPFSGSPDEIRLKKLTSDPPSPLTFKPELDPKLAAVCCRMISRGRNDRYENASDVIKALRAVKLGDAVLEPGGSMATTQSPAPDPSEFDEFLATIKPHSETARLLATAGPRSHRIRVVGVFSLIVILSLGYFMRDRVALSTSRRSVPVAQGTAPTRSHAPNGERADAQAGTSAPLTLAPLNLAGAAKDFRFAVLVANGILLSPNNRLFTDEERDAIAEHQAGRETFQNDAVLFYFGSVDLASDGGTTRVHNLSQEGCLTAWIAFREGHEPGRIDVALDSRDVLIDGKGSDSVGLLAIVFPKSFVPADHSLRSGLDCKLLKQRFASGRKRSDTDTLESTNPPDREARPERNGPTTMEPTEIGPENEVLKKIDGERVLRTAGRSDPSEQRDIEVGASVIATANVGGYREHTDDILLIVDKGTKGTVIKIAKDKKRCLVRLAVNNEPNVWILHEKLQLVD